MADLSGPYIIAMKLKLRLVVIVAMFSSLFYPLSQYSRSAIKSLIDNKEFFEGTKCLF